MTQEMFKSYRETKGPEETNKWVEEQRALGNPKILPKDVWTNLVRNSYMNENFIFTGCSELQAFRTMTKQALLNSLEHDVDIALTDNNADFIQEAVDIIDSYTDAEEFIIDGQSRSL